MINFEQFTLGNGLQVFVHQDPKSLTAAFNLCYGVGSRDEDPKRTGFAHLFEHLMFGGSVNVPSFDEPIQKAGGTNNAFTSLDITNYYITLPYQNLETAFWLESDRMLSLTFDPKVLSVQKSVVIEEFKQRYLNQPYGDLWLTLRPLVYKKHPYRWATIGKDVQHIENATMDDVRNFFFRFYRPNNAVLVVAGPVNVDQVKELAEKWFSSIPAGPTLKKEFPQEETQTAARQEIHTADVPVKSLYKVFRTPEKYSKASYAMDLFADALGRGQTSALYQNLVKDKGLFTSLSAHHSAYQDGGLFVINGSLSDDVTFEEADASLSSLLEAEIQQVDYTAKLAKVKVQSLSLEKFGETEVLNRAMKLAFAAISGDPNRCNTVIETIDSIDHGFMKATAKEFLRADASNTLFYSPKE